MAAPVPKHGEGARGLRAADGAVVDTLGPARARGHFWHEGYTLPERANCWTVVSWALRQVSAETQPCRLQKRTICLPRQCISLNRTKRSRVISSTVTRRFRTKGWPFATARRRVRSGSRRSTVALRHHSFGANVQARRNEAG